jgi:hypothetical protein
MGILTQLPDLTEVLNKRGVLVASFRAVTEQLPMDPGSLTSNLTDGLEELGDAIPTNPQALTGALQSSLGSLADLFPKDKLPALQDLSNGLSQALSIVAPAREILASGNGLRDLREVIFEKAGDPNAFISNLLAELSKFIPADAVEVLQNFISTLKDFEASIPSDPSAIAGFLAQSFLGVPVNLLAAPLERVNDFHAKIDALVDLTNLNNLNLKIQETANQLVTCRTLIKDLNLADAAGYQAVAGALTGVQAEMANIQGLLSGLATGFQSGLAALDLNGFTNKLQNTLENFPEIKVAQVDDFLNLVTEPLKQLNRKLDDLSSEQLAQAFSSGKEFFASMITDQGFEEIRETFLKPFHEIGSAIEGLNLDQVRTAITDALNKIGDGINQVAATIQNVKNDVKNVINQISDVLEKINLVGSEVESAISALVTDIQNALRTLPLTEFGNQIENVIKQLDSLLSDFTSVISPAIEALNAVRDELEKIDLRQAAEPGFEAMQTVKGTLEKLDLSQLGSGEAAALRIGLEVLAQIDLSPVRKTLTDAYDEVVPRDPLNGLAGKYQEFVGKMTEYRPGNLLDPLLQPFTQLKDSLRQFDPAALLDPVIPQLEELKTALDNVTAEQLIAPLTRSFDELIEAMDDFAPSKLLAPLSDVFQEFLALFEKLNIAPLLDELEDMFAQWLEQSLAGVQNLANGFSGASELRSYLDGINGTPSGAEFGFMPGDILRPVEDLFNKIMSLLDQVPDDKLLAAFQSLQTQFIDALQIITPSRLVVDMYNRLRQRLASFDFLNNYEVLAGLYAPYSNLVLEFDAIDQVQVRAEFRANYEKLAALIAAVNPAQVFTPLRPQFQALNGCLASIAGSFDSTGLSPLFGPIKEKVTALIPSYLHGELRLDTLKSQLQQLNPGRFADEVNQEFEAFLIKLSKFGDTLVAELPKLAETIQTGTISFLPELIKEAFNALYNPLKAKCDVLNPASIIAEIESSIFNPVKAALENLNPATIFSDLELDDKFEEFKAALNSIINNLQDIQIVVASFWSELLGNLDQFDPAHLQTQADAAFAPVQQFITNLNLRGMMEAVEQALARIRSDLDKVLQEAEVALQDMINAIPE